MQHPSPAPVDRASFVSAMRQVAASVTVVTTDGPMGRFGATVSAFASVSADPPSVLVCLHGQSRIAQAVAANGRFCVNILPEGSTDIADRFAGRHDGWITDRFSGIDCYGTPGTAPLIEGATGFACDLAQSVPSGSHLIVIGHVTSVFDAGTAPLAWRDGGYHRVVPKDAARCAAE
ncbi:flavin reductase family protein [Roseovarius mucosus]|uniref:flavin reductase family protein n=1 Tax=Roseovarius mucosus TaxID=215743 RepID=UPI003F7089D2